MRGEKRLLTPGAQTRTIIVADGRVTGTSPPEDVKQSCVRFAQQAGTELLGLDFADGAAGPWTFVGANPMPDLRWGGPALINALMDALAMRQGVPA
jgi:hypothetical protein